MQGTVEIQLCLLEGQTEITLTYDLDLHPKIERKTLWCLEPYVLLSNQHPLSELEGEPMVLFDGPNSHDHFNAILSPQNFRSNVQHRRDTFELVRSLVANDRGFSIVNLKPKTTECYDGEQVAYVPLQDPEGGLSVGIAILEAARRTAKAEVFWSNCKSVIPANLRDCRQREFQRQRFAAVSCVSKSEPNRNATPIWQALIEVVVSRPPGIDVGTSLAVKAII